VKEGAATVHVETAPSAVIRAQLESSDAGYRGLNLVNTPAFKIPSCTPAPTSAINNSPRAVVWLAGRIVCNSRARPASKSLRERKPSIVPATGLHSEKQHGFRRVPSKQGPPKGSFLNFLSSVIGVRRKWRFVRTEDAYCCAFQSSFQLSRRRFPRRSRLWKSSGNPVGKRRLTGYTPHRMLVKFRGQSVSL
jgi:hypothetical protein